MGSGALQRTIQKHNALAKEFEELHREHENTRRVVVQLIEAHNRFVGMSLFNRLRWAFRGRYVSPKTEQ